MGWRQLGLRRCGRKSQRLEEFNERWLLLRNQSVVTGHLEEPRRAISALDCCQNASFLSRAGVLPSLLRQRRCLAADTDRLRQLGKFILRHGQLGRPGRASGSRCSGSPAKRGSGITLTSATLPAFPGARNEAARISPGAASSRQPAGSFHWSFGRAPAISGWPGGIAVGGWDCEGCAAPWPLDRPGYGSGHSPPGRPPTPGAPTAWQRAVRMHRIKNSPHSIRFLQPVPQAVVQSRAENVSH